MSSLASIGGTHESLDIWLVDLAGNIAMSETGLALLRRIRRLRVPFFSSTEQAAAWGSRLNAEQHATLLDIQRTSSSAARGERNLQRMIDLGMRSQLLREAAEAFVPDFAGRKSLPMLVGGPPQGDGNWQN